MAGVARFAIDMCVSAALISYIAFLPYLVAILNVPRAFVSCFLCLFISGVMSGKAEYDFIVEYAKSNRSTCKGTKQKIEKGASLPVSPPFLLPSHFETAHPRGNSHRQDGAEPSL